MLKILTHVLTIAGVALSNVSPKTILLNDGNTLPAIGFGTLGKVKDIHLIKPPVVQAIEAGYRHIVTAGLYQNEAVVGEAIADVISRGIVTREELWITTKLKITVGNGKDVVPALRDSLEKLQVDYVDLYSIHFSRKLGSNTKYNYIDIWKGMEDAKKLNLTRSIGVSNFKIEDINNILINSDTTPSVNEIEVHPSFTNLDLVAYCQSHKIAVISYAPLGFTVPRPFISNSTITTHEASILKKIGQKYGKTVNQVTLRYLIDRGTIPIPRSTSLEHIKSNIDVFDFNLTQKEIDMINELNKDRKIYDFDGLLDNLLDYYFKDIDIFSP